MNTANAEIIEADAGFSFKALLVLPIRGDHMQLQSRFKHQSHHLQQALLTGRGSTFLFLAFTASHMTPSRPSMRGIEGGTGILKCMHMF